jgi:hypothetical protein
MEINSPPCPTHGSFPRALHSENFEGIVTVITETIETVSGVGTSSYSRCPYGYPSNFEGVVRALEDLNTSISGIQTNVNLAAGSGIYIVPSGDFDIIHANYGVIVSGALRQGSNINFVYGTDGSVTVNSSAIISGTQAAVFVQDNEPPNLDGALWFDTKQGRLFVYGDNPDVSDPAWYQSNAEALALKSEVPPSGAGLNAPPRDGSIWFNTLLGSLFVYDTTTSGWYEASPSRSFAYGPAAPAPSAEGAGWYDESTSSLKVWDGTAWVSV